MLVFLNPCGSNAKPGKPNARRWNIGCVGSFVFVVVVFLLFFYIVCFTSYFVFSIAVLPQSPGVVYYHLLLRRKTRIPGLAPFSFQDLFVYRGQKT